MKKRFLQLLMGITVTASILTTAFAPANIVFAANKKAATEATTEVATEKATEAETEAATKETKTEETSAEANLDSSRETVKEQADDFVEGSALLSDYNYKEGELTKTDWKSEFLGMNYKPEKSISMGVEQNDTLNTYYLRNGKDKQVATNEMVALEENGGYLQVMAEVNPNNEKAEDILERLAANEELTMIGSTKEMKIAGKTFQTCTGVKDKEKYMVGVCTDVDNIAVALKTKYKDTDVRKTLLAGFSESDADKTTNKVVDSAVEKPEAFEDNEVITEKTTESATEVAETEKK